MQPNDRDSKAAEHATGGAAPAKATGGATPAKGTGDAVPAVKEYSIDGKQTIEEQENALQAIEAFSREVTAYVKNDKDASGALTNNPTVKELGRHDPQPKALKLVALEANADEEAIEGATGDMVLAFKGAAYVSGKEQTVLGLRENS
jgi:hypothetical protein